MNATQKLRRLGGTYTRQRVACDECNRDFHNREVWSDGKMLCFACDLARVKAIHTDHRAGAR